MSEQWECVGELLEPAGAVGAAKAGEARGAACGVRSCL